MKLVCIPAYNEESHIENLVKLAKNYVDSVIVCDDCSTDDTTNIAKKAGAVVISHKTNQEFALRFETTYSYLFL